MVKLKCFTQGVSLKSGFFTVFISKESGLFPKLSILKFTWFRFDSKVKIRNIGRAKKKLFWLVTEWLLAFWHPKSLHILDAHVRLAIVPPSESTKVLLGICGKTDNEGVTMVR